nr:ABC transporter permease [Maliibacterium massiliense]
MENKSKMHKSVSMAKTFEKIGKFWTLGIFVLILCFFALQQSRIFSIDYWGSTLEYMTEILLLAIGEGMVMLTGGIDLSIGAASGFIGVTTAVLIKAFVPAMGEVPAIILAIVIGIGIGVVLGFINGTIITRMKLSPFLATIGTMGICAGLSLVLSEGHEVVGLPRIMGEFANHRMLGFITPNVLVSWLVLLFFVYRLHCTRWGLYTYACGSNIEAAKRAGINATRHVTGVYINAGLMAALSGILLMMRFTSASPLTGQTTQLIAVAAAAIGGINSKGGSGKAEGILLGALIISVVMTGLVVINVQAYWQQVAVGVIIVLSVYMDQFSDRARLR